MKILKQTTLLLLLVASSVFSQSIKPHTIAIVVSDIEVSEKWYADVLQMQPFKQMLFPEYDGLKIHFLKNDSFRLELMEKNSSFAISKYVEDYDINKSPLIGFSKIAFSVDDIESEFNRISNLNVNVFMGITEDKQFHSKFFIIKDPDGNSVQFIQDLVD